MTATEVLTVIAAFVCVVCAVLLCLLMAAIVIGVVT